MLARLSNAVEEARLHCAWIEDTLEVEERQQLVSGLEGFAAEAGDDAAGDVGREVVGLGEGEGVVEVADDPMLVVGVVVHVGLVLDRLPQDDLRAALREERIRYVSVRREGNGLVALLRSTEDRSRVLDMVRQDQSLQGLIVDEMETEEYFGISATVQEQALLELQQTALKQNITTLRNRVNEIGVAEPLIQQQGADRVHHACDFGQRCNRAGNVACAGDGDVVDALAILVDVER